MKSFNNHSGLRGLPCLAEGIYWATGSSLTTPFTEGRLGVNDEASPPGRHQEQAPKQRCTFSPTAFSSVQRLSWTSALLAVGITPTTTAGFSKGLPALLTELPGGWFISDDPFTEGCEGVNHQTLPPSRSNVLCF